MSNACRSIPSSMPYGSVLLLLTARDRRRRNSVRFELRLLVRSFPLAHSGVRARSQTISSVQPRQLFVLQHRLGVAKWSPPVAVLSNALENSLGYIAFTHRIKPCKRSGCELSTLNWLVSFMRNSRNQKKHSSQTWGSPACGYQRCRHGVDSCLFARISGYK